MAVTVGGVDIQIRGDDADFRRTMRDVQREAGRTGQTMTREFRTASNEAGRLKTQIMGTTSAFVGLAAVISGTVLAGAITQAADAFASMRSRINLAIDAADDLLTVERQLYEQAVANRAALEPTVALYQRLRGARADLTNEQTLAITDRWSKTLIVSGASAQGAAAATLQFSQAIAGGILRAEEFNSIIENNIRFVKLLADSLGVSVGEIRNLVNEGVITSDIIFEALQNNAASLDDEFAKIPITVNSALQNLNNAFVSYVGLADQSSGASATLAGFINSLAQNFDRLAEAVIIAAAAIGGAFGAQAALAATSALASIARGATGAAGAMTILRAASAFMLGPAGFVVAVSALAAGFAAVTIHAGSAAREFEALRDAATEAGSALANYNNLGSSTILQRQAADLSAIKEEYYGIAAAAAEAAEAEKSRRVNALLSERAQVAAGLRALENRRGNRDLRRAGRTGERQRLDADIEKARALLAEYDAAIEATASQRIQDIAKELPIPTARKISDEERLAAQKAADLAEKQRLLRIELERNFDLELAQASNDQDAIRAAEYQVELARRISNYLEANLSLEQATSLARAEILAIRNAETAALERQAEVERQQVQDIADKKIEEAQGERALMLARARGNEDEIRALQEILDFRKRVAEYQAAGLSAADAVQQAELDAAAVDALRQAEIRREFTDQVAAGLEEGIRTGQWGDVFEGILADAAINALSDAISDLANVLADLLSGVFSGIGSSIGASLFGGGRAAGGIVRAGERYLVGEQGPEMFVPTVPGMIVPEFNGPPSAAGAAGFGAGGISISAPFIVQGSITEEVLPRVQAMMAAQARELPRVIDARVADSIRRTRY